MWEAFIVGLCIIPLFPLTAAAGETQHRDKVRELKYAYSLERADYNFNLKSFCLH